MPSSQSVSAGKATKHISSQEAALDKAAGIPAERRSAVYCHTKEIPAVIVRLERHKALEIKDFRAIKTSLQIHDAIFVEL